VEQEDTRKNIAEKPKLRILRKAATLFARKGYGSTGLRELAAAADVNLAMINYFFGSKKALLKAVLDVFFQGYLEIARKELIGPAEPRIKLERFICRAVAFFASHQDALLVAITELSHDDPEIIEYKASWGRRMMEVIDREICVPLSRETGSTLPPQLIAPMLSLTMASRFIFSPIISRLQGENQELSIDEYSRMISLFFIGGVLNLGSEGGAIHDSAGTSALNLKPECRIEPGKPRVPESSGHAQNFKQEI
jgi:AcrR family transcriptional regulator